MKSLRISVFLCHNKIKIIFCGKTCRKKNPSLHEKCPYLEFLWPVFSRIWTEYGEVLHMRSECGKIWTRKTTNTDTFHAASVVSRTRMLSVKLEAPTMFFLWNFTSKYRPPWLNPKRMHIDILMEPKYAWSIQGKDLVLRVVHRVVRRVRNDLEHRSDHQQYVKRRKLSQPSKKLKGPVQFSVTKMHRFLEYEICKDTSWQRSK